MSGNLGLGLVLAGVGIPLATVVSLWLYSEVRRVLFQFRVECLSGMDSTSRSKLIKGVRSQKQWRMLRRALESSSVSTDTKVEMCRELIERDQKNFSFFLRSDYLPRLMMVAQGDYQRLAADVALRLAAQEQDVLLEVVKSLERLSDPELTEIVLKGVSRVVANLKSHSDLATMWPSKLERAIVVSQIASKLGDPNDGVRRVAAQVIRDVLAQDIVAGEGVFMTLLRDQRREVKELVAELVLDHKAQLPGATCCAWIVRTDLSPELRSRF